MIWIVGIAALVFGFTLGRSSALNELAKIMSELQQELEQARWRNQHDPG